MEPRQIQCFRGSLRCPSDWIQTFGLRSNLRQREGGGQRHQRWVGDNWTGSIQCLDYIQVVERSVWSSSPLIGILVYLHSDSLYYRSHQPDQVEQGLDKTLSDLGLEYLDLYLMHWPVTSSGGRNYIDYVDVGPNALSSFYT